MSMHCRKRSKIKVLGKFGKKYQKISKSEDSRSPKGAPRGANPWPGASLVRPGGWPRHLAAWARGTPPRAPFVLYLPLVEEISKENFVTRKALLFRRRRDSDLEIARRNCPGTLPEGGLTSGGLSITMIASGMSRSPPWDMGP